MSTAAKLRLPGFRGRAVASVTSREGPVCDAHSARRAGVADHRRLRRLRRRSGARLRPAGVHLPRPDRSRQHVEATRAGAAQPGGDRAGVGGGAESWLFEREHSSDSTRTEYQQCPVATTSSSRWRRSTRRAAVLETAGWRVVRLRPIGWNGDRAAGIGWRSSSLAGRTTPAKGASPVDYTAREARDIFEFDQVSQRHGRSIPGRLPSMMPHSCSCLAADRSVHLAMISRRPAASQRAIGRQVDRYFIGVWSRDREKASAAKHDRSRAKRLRTAFDPPVGRMFAPLGPSCGAAELRRVLRR